MSVIAAVVKNGEVAIAEAGIQAAAEFDDGCNLPITSEVIKLDT